MGASNSTQKDHVLQTARGSLIGIEVSDTRTKQPIYRRYSRIRYCLPPVGDRRWRKPEPLPSDWLFSDGNKYPRNYRNLGTICPQASTGSVMINGREWSDIVQNDMSEDCLFLNIWVPAGGEGPVGGWPVQFVYFDFPRGEYIAGHGMQQNFLDPIDIFREHRDNPRIIVSANFRCGVFGFLASEELLHDNKDLKSDPYVASGNFGLWDLRMALEWTHANIHLFGGNPYNVTAGGMGEIAAYQLHYDSFLPPNRRIIRRAFLFSGAVSVQPDIPQSGKPRAQFAALCRRFNIDIDLPSEDKVRLLRGVSAEKLLSFVKTLDLSFKPITDGQGGFVPTWFMKSIWNGELGRRLKELGVQVLIGDPSNEKALYQFWNQQDEEKTMSSATISNAQDLSNKLRLLYPEDIVQALIAKYPTTDGNWPSTYSAIQADIQCHSAVRGFAHSLFKGGMTAQDVLRYHIAWRPKGLSDWLEPSTSVSHVLDIPLWWYSGWRAGFSSRDRQDVLNFTQPFARFIRGDISALFGWGTETETDVRILAQDGSVFVADDPLWKAKLEIYNLIRDVQLRRNGGGVMRRQVQELP